MLAVDLVLFNCFVIRSRSPRPAPRPQAPVHRLSAQVGDGRFIIYDPDEFYTDQLYALGQTDLNIYDGCPAARATPP